MVASSVPLCVNSTFTNLKVQSYEYDLCAFSVQRQSGNESCRSECYLFVCVWPRIDSKISKKAPPDGHLSFCTRKPSHVHPNLELQRAAKTLRLSVCVAVVSPNLQGSNTSNFVFFKSETWIKGEPWIQGRFTEGVGMGIIVSIHSVPLARASATTNTE